MSCKADDVSDSNSYRERYFTSQNGSRLFFRDYGDPAAGSTPVLCLPGLSRNSHDFHRLAERLATGRRVISVDYQGRGRSQFASDWRHYAAENDLNDLRHLIAVTGLHRAIVVGTSYGGLLAMGLGVVVPRAIAGVVLNDVGPEISSSGQARILHILEQGLPQPDWASAVSALKQMLPHLPFKTEAEWNDLARGSYLENEGGGLRVAWDTNIVKPLRQSGGRTPDLWALFRSLRNVPVLVIRGALSDILSEATVARMAEIYPLLSHVTLPDTAHPAKLTEPSSLQAIDEMLDRSAHDA